MKIRQYFEDINYKVTGRDIMDFQGIVHRIVSEYLALVKNAGAEEETLKKVRNDIAVTFSLLLTEKGGIRDLTEQLVGHRKGDTLDFFISQLMSPFISFIDARVYDSLNEALDKTVPIFNINFVNWSCQKAGIMPEIKGGIPMPAPKEEIKEKKGK